MKSRTFVVGAKNTSGSPPTPPAGNEALLWEATQNEPPRRRGRMSFPLRLLCLKLLGVKGSEGTLKMAQPVPSAGQTKLLNDGKKPVMRLYGFLKVDH